MNGWEWVVAGYAITIGVWGAYAWRVTRRPSRDR